MTISQNGEIRFGRDILPLFGLLALFILLLSAHLLFVRLGAGATGLAELDTLTAAVGAACGSYISYIVLRVVVLTRGQGG
jgi:hypothetical protein